MKQFNYHYTTGEFVENPNGHEYGDMTGNRVYLTMQDDGLYRFRIEIDALGDVVAALYRLVARVQPGFCFEIKKGRKV